MKKLAMVITFMTVALMLAWAVPVMAEDMGKVNLNTAGREELMTLEGIGGSYADRIIEYRKKKGPFQSPADIVNVKGIGERTYELNKDRLIVQDVTSK